MLHSARAGLLAAARARDRERRAMRALTRSDGDQPRARTSPLARDGYIHGAGPFAVLEPWPDSRSGWSVSLWYSERCARDLAYSIGHRL